MIRIVVVLFFFGLYPGFPMAQEMGGALSAERLKWGEEQLRQMLKDRPLMAAYVKDGDEVWNWAVRRFAGEGLPLPIKWDPDYPEPIWEAMSLGPDEYRKTPGWIKVTRNYILEGKDSGKPKSALMLWGDVFMELSNTRNSSRSYALDLRAWGGKISREAYVIERYLVEMDTLRDVHEFFKYVWAPHCEKLGLPAEDEELAHHYGKGMKPGPIEYMVDMLYEPNNYHRKLSEKSFDEILAERAQEMDKEKKGKIEAVAQ